MARKKAKGIELSVFKGREAKLNRAIFRIIIARSPLTIYEAHKQIKAMKGLRQAKYSTVNKRFKALQQMGYIRRIGSRDSKAGFEIMLYEPTNKFYLAFVLNAHDFDELLSGLDERASMEILLLLMEVITGSSEAKLQKQNHCFN